ncbi:Ig-like domain-containing protein [Roseateles sp.]|uniref:Ig-like domain-containing protein n=1 Tax=Roseateles sp. TaxID=1971397 RepID=UPI0031D536CF
MRDDTGASIDADPEQRSARDGRTRDATVLVDGIASGAIWEYSRDGIDWIEGSGNRRIDASFFGSNDGAKSVHVRQVDTAGHQSAIQTLAFVLDRTAPAVTPLTLLDRDGAASADRVSSNAGLRVAAETGNYWFYFFDTGHSGQGIGAGITDASLRVPDGQRTLTVKQYDGAGNYSEATTSFWLDRTPPSTPMAQLDQDTGISASDRLTQNGSLTISGLEVASVWKYRIDGGAWVTRAVDSKAATIPSSAFGADGHKRVEIMQTDPAGNDSGLCVFEFDLDRIALAPMLYLQNDTGRSGDLITSDPTVVLGAVEPGARWQWRPSVFQAWEDTSSVQFNPGVTSGRSMVHIRQVDVAGNLSDARVLSSWIAPAGDEAQQPLLNAKGDDALLVGTLGADVFKWQPKTVMHTGFDRVLNYRVDQGDVIDLTGILDLSSGPPQAERLVKMYGLVDQAVVLNVVHSSGAYVDYAIQLWNTLLTDPIAVRVGAETFMV